MVAYAPKSTLDESGSPVNWLRVFRESLYAYLRAEALFELAHATLMAGSAPSPVHLSLRPVRRRGRGSLYAALKKVRGGVAEPARVSSPSARRCRRPTPYLRRRRELVAALPRPVPRGATTTTHRHRTSLNGEVELPRVMRTRL